MICAVRPMFPGNAPGSGPAAVRRQEAGVDPLGSQRGSPLVLIAGSEDQIGARTAGQPAIRLDLAFELPRPPSRITERKQRTLGPRAARHVLEDIEGRGHGEALAHREARALNPVVRRMQHEAPAMLDRSPEMDLDGIHVHAALDLQLPQQVAKPQLRRRLVDDEPHGPVGGMRAEKDHRSLESRIPDAGHRNEKLSVEKALVRCHDAKDGRMTAPWQGAAARRGGERPNVIRPATRPEQGALPAARHLLKLALLLLVATVSLGAPSAPARAQGLPAGGIAVREVRLIEGWQQRDGTRMAAIEIRLQPGWHTYWRIPGEAGIAPEIDWSGSRNLASVAYHWPRPEVFEQSGLTSFGHADRLVLPVVLTPTDPGAPIEARARLDFGVCNEICTPADADISAQIAPGTPQTGRAVIAAALATAPLEGGAAGITGIDCQLVTENGGPALRADIAFDTDAPPLDHAIFESAGRLVGLGTGSSRGRTLRAEARLLPGAAVDRSALRLTLVGDGSAVEILGCGM